jgi:PadR family transcriptional regulator PadR
VTGVESVGRKPLKEKQFHILLALAGGPLHGFAIQRAVEQQTDGQLHLWPATLYGSLEALVNRGLIEEVTDPGQRPATSEKRRYYSITPRGSQQLAQLADRMSRLADLAKARIGEVTPS